MRCSPCAGLLLALVSGFNAQELPRKPPLGPFSPINERLPRWLRLKGEYRGRWEGTSALRFAPEAEDHYLLTRLRLALTLQPLSWLTASIQGQDSRISGNSLYPTAPPYQDEWEVQQVWFEFKHASNVRLRVGRQELTLGEQRLLGPSNWGNTARSFDAARVAWDGKDMSFEVFAASVVAQRAGQWNHHIDGDNLHGGAFRAGGLPGKSRIELQALWRLVPRVLSETGRPGKLNTKTVVLRSQGNLSAHTRYVTEMAVQRGTRSSDRSRSWAGHWRVARDIGNGRWKPVIVAVHDYASGDSDPADGRNGTFDTLYPTPHDKYGLADQIGWKNIRHAEVRLELSPLRGWRFDLKQHAWWLVSARDGVYTAGGALVARDVTGRSGRYVGRETDIQAIWIPSQQFSIGTGIARISPGEFLKKTTPGAALIYPYVMVTYGF